MHIGQPLLDEDSGTARYRVDVRLSSGSEHQLVFSVDSAFADFLSLRADAAVVALLPVAMRRGKDITVEGPISSDLLAQIRSDYRYLVGLHMNTIPIEVTGTSVKWDSSIARGVGAGFSAGIDSSQTIADHFLDATEAPLRISHLLFNDVGSHGADDDAAQRFASRLRRIRIIAEQFGLPLIVTTSNLDDFYRLEAKKIGFQATHTARNASVALALEGGVERYYSTSTIDYVNVRQCTSMYVNVGVSSNDMAYSDTTSPPLISTSSIRLLSSGSRYSRVEKTLRAAEIPEARRSLDVCMAGPSDRTNCSKCWKCLRTMLTLDVAGFIDEFEEAFDITTCRTERDHYVKSVVRSSDPLLREIVEFASTVGKPLERFRFPRPLRLYRRR